MTIGNMKIGLERAAAPVESPRRTPVSQGAEGQPARYGVRSQSGSPVATVASPGPLQLPLHVALSLQQQGLIAPTQAEPPPDEPFLDLSDQQVTTALSLIGIDLPAHPAPQDLLAAREVLALLPDDILAVVVNPGLQVELTVPVVGGSLPPGSPVRVAGEVQFVAEVELSDVVTGAGFEQTQQLEFSVEARAGLGLDGGSTLVAKLKKWIGRAGELPGAASLSERALALIDNSPLSRFAASLPVSFQLREFTGFRLSYEAVVTPEQGALIADGDLSAAPDPTNPLEMEEGTSVLIRGQSLAGTSLEASYKLLYVGGQRIELEGAGFSVTRLEGDVVQVAAGPIETVENELHFGIGKPGLFFVGVGSQDSTEQRQLATAQIDLSTSAGQDAYATFLATGQVPPPGAPGTLRAGTTTVTVNESADFFGASVGGFGVSVMLDDYWSEVSMTEWADGTAEFTAVSGPESDITVTANGRLDQDGALIGEAEWTIVFADRPADMATGTAVAFDLSSDPQLSGNHHIQLTVTASDLMQIREQAREAVARLQNEGTLQSLDEGSPPLGLEQSIASADTPHEVLMAIVRHGGDPALLLGIAGPLDQSLQGEVEVRPASDA